MAEGQTRQTVIAVEGLGKRFGARWVFRNLSFDVEKGDRLAILGSNGAGKSTLLRIIAGLGAPSEGRSQLGVADVRTGLGFSAVEQALYPHLTVREHIELAARLRGCPSRLDSLLDQVGLIRAANVPATYLSTGMKARLRFAIAIQAEPEILLLDEPSASLDEPGRALVASIVEEQAARGCVLIATNDPSERRWANAELELAQ